MTHAIDTALMTSETWSDYQALELIETQLGASLARLTNDQRSTPTLSETLSDRTPGKAGSGRGNPELQEQL